MKDGHQVIDSDGHVIEPADLWDRYIDSQFYGVRPICDPANTEVRTMGHTMSRSHVRTPGSDYDVDDYRKRIVEGWFAKYQAQKEKGFSAESYVEMMDAEGIDQMVLFPSRGLYAASVGDLDGRLSSAICRAYNRWLHDFCSHDPQRLIGAGLVALHDPTLAADEATYAVRELGMRSIMIRPNPYAGRNLEDRAYDEFYATVADLDVALATHEGVGVWMPEYGQDRYESRLAQHAMSHAMEQMGAVYSFTAGGVMHRHPTLRVAILEAGGGWLPYWLDRLDEHFEWLGEVESEDCGLTMPPSGYFRRQGWINCEPGEPGIAHVVEYLGSNRLLWASDYPHPDGVFPGTVDKLLTAKGFVGDQLQQYAATNARELYGL